MATYYIRADSSINGDGTSPVRASSPGGVGAFNASPTLTANNTYKYRREGVYTAIRPQTQNSAAATPLTIGAFWNDDGTDDTTKARPLFDHRGGANGVGAIFVDDCDNVLIQDVAGTNSIAAGGAAVRTRRSNGVTVRRCTGYNNTHGIAFTQDQASGTSTSTDHLIEDCTVHSNLGSGILLQWGGVSTAQHKRVKILRNEVYNNGLGTNANTRGGIMSENSWQTDNSAAYCSYDVEISDNEVYSNRSYGVHMYCIRTESWGRNKILRNHIYRNGISRNMDTHSLWAGSVFNTDIRWNHIHDNAGWDNGSVGSCVGIYLDFTSASGVGGDNNRVQFNFIHDQWQGPSSSALPGSAIHLLANSNCLIESNIVRNCRNGISISSSGANSNIVRNNTILDITSVFPGGHGICVTVGTSNLIYGNIIKNVRTGFFVATSGTTSTAESYNIVYQADNPFNVGTLTSQTASTLAASDITSDPQLDENYAPRLSSPAIGALAVAGIAKNAQRRDYKGRYFRIAPAIGALEYGNDREAAIQRIQRSFF